MTRSMTSHDNEAGIVPPAAIGLIGLGKMGAPMGANLLRAGFAVRGYDSTAAVRERFAEANGIAICTSAAQACRDVAAVITMLPDGRVVREVLTAPDVTAELKRTKPLVIDMSSSSPVDTRRLGEALGAIGCAVLDAPVSGGVKRAIDGSLAIMAGGEAGAVARARPLLRTMGGAVFATGPLGSGHAMKALNNYVSAAGLAAAAEALLIGRRFGLDPSVMVEVLNASTGKNNATENKLKQHILSGTYGSGFAVGLMSKDLSIAAGLARHERIGAPLAAATALLWKEALEALGAEADHTEIFRYLERLATEEGG